MAMGSFYLFTTKDLTRQDSGDLASYGLLLLQEDILSLDTYFRVTSSWHLLQNDKARTSIYDVCFVSFLAVAWLLTFLDIGLLVLLTPLPFKDRLVTW